MLDVRVEDQGTIVLFTPESDDGSAWMDDNVYAEDWQFIGSGVAVEHRYAPDLVAGMIGDGLALSGVRLA